MTASMEAQDAVLSIRDVSKNYEAIQALSHVSVEFEPGHVSAVVGQNGAGKSTLMKILAGIEQPDDGEIWLRGQRTQLRSARKSSAEGIAIVHQELSVFPDLDVLANLFLLREPTGPTRLVDRREMARQARPVLDELGLHILFDTRVDDLTLGQQQTLEIARALLSSPDILILDEPNSALNAEETERLLRIVTQLAARGVAVIYISHRLEEVFRIADSITVVRNGGIVARLNARSTSIPAVVELMIGRTPTPVDDNRKPRPATTAAHDGLQLRDITVPGSLDQVNLLARPGEIVGLVGLEGSGVTAVFDVIFGGTKAQSGTVSIAGTAVGAGPPSIRRAVRLGVARVPSDRRKYGASLSQSILENVSLVSAGPLARRGRVFLDGSMLRRRAATRCTAVGVKAPSVDSYVHELSGGNQQKVVLAKWLEADPTVVLLDDPTRGVDVEAKREIYALLDRLAHEGRVVLFHSSELIEYGLLCDRAVVFYKGRTVAELGRDQLSEHQLLEAINTGDPIR